MPIFSLLWTFREAIIKEREEKRAGFCLRLFVSKRIRNLQEAPTQLFISAVCLTQQRDRTRRKAGRSRRKKAKLPFLSSLMATSPIRPQSSPPQLNKTLRIFGCHLLLSLSCMSAVHLCVSPSLSLPVDELVSSAQQYTVAGCLSLRYCL
mmetsp:Transcript_47490/g.93648  ORF Transcript_47490/g.93648 Transcript_47490/m.93648 type:complete len:150 (+) Transcript_47490:281-730(+)